MVPPVWIEQTTCRLQGGCSTTELRRRRRAILRDSPGLSGAYEDGRQVGSPTEQVAGQPSRPVGFLVGFPLDAAAHTRCLLRWHRPAAEEGFACRAQIRTSHGNLVPGTAGIEPTVIRKPPLAIEQEEIRSTHCLVLLRHFLRLVIQVWERDEEAITKKDRAWSIT